MVNTSVSSDRNVAFLFSSGRNVASSVSSARNAASSVSSSRNAASTTMNLLRRKIPETSRTDNGAPKNRPNNAVVVTRNGVVGLCKETALARPIKFMNLSNNMSPLQRPNQQQSKMASRFRMRHLSCPVQVSQRRLMYECPKCHRYRNSSDDRDKFILYGVTRLWPTPPPAPPEAPSPTTQPEDTSGNSQSGIDGAYSICRIFHTKSAKLHPRTAQKKKRVIIPTPALAWKPAAPNKQEPESASSTLLVPNPSPCLSLASGGSSDLIQMVSMLRRYVTPRDRLILNRSAPASNINKKIVITQAAPKSSETANITRTFKTSSRTQSALEVSNASSPKRPTLKDSASARAKFVAVTSAPSTCPSKATSHLSISQAKLETWTRRLRYGAYLNRTGKLLDTTRNQMSAVSGDPIAAAKKRRKNRKRYRSRITKSKSKCEDTSKAEFVIPQATEEQKKLSAREINLSKPEAPSPLSGVWAANSARVVSVKASSTCVQVTKKSLRHRRQRRDRSFKVQSSPSGDQKGQQETSNTAVVATIEAVKIGEEVEVEKKRKFPKPSRKKRSTKSVSVSDKISATDSLTLLGTETETVVKNITSCFNPKPSNDPVALLQEFRNRMKKCQGKGRIKPSHIEVMAYLESRKSETKFQTLPKTYQQMGLAPLTRSPSSENSTQFLKFKCALSDTDIAPKVSLRDYSQKRKKKKRKKQEKSRRRKDVGDDETKDVVEASANVRHVKRNATPKKKKSKHRCESIEVADVDTAVSASSE